MGLLDEKKPEVENLVTLSLYLNKLPVFARFRAE
jgi:hypothetical protein